MGRTLRRALLAALAGACLALPAVAHPQATGGTRSGTLVGVAVQLQIVTQPNGDGTVTRCGVDRRHVARRGGGPQLRAGGVLRPDDTLEPGVQATIDTLREGSRLGSAAIATITYEGSRMLCGHTLGLVRHRRVAEGGPGADAQSPGRRRAGDAVPTPQPITRTATGYISRMSPLRPSWSSGRRPAARSGRGS